MRRFATALILLACTTFSSSLPGTAWGKDTDTLITLDGVRYTAADFKRWWELWKDEKSPLPKTPDTYVDWMLLAREGERMELVTDPNVQHKLRVFLQSRSLLLLKGEDVDGKINLTDADLKARYDKAYLPRWLLERLQFKDESSARDASHGLNDGTVMIEELSNRSVDLGGPAARREDWRRPLGMDEGWVTIFGGLAPGQASEPFPYGNHYVIYRLKEKKEGDPEDFEKVKKEIRETLWKEREEALTHELLVALRQKYDVKVDQARLDALDLGAADDSFSDSPIVSTNRQNFTEKEFMSLVRRETDFQHATRSPLQGKEMKERVLAGLINQTLTNWESLDRRYQEKEPFKWEFQFYLKNRLVKALEDRLFAPSAAATEAEVKKYYQDNISTYSQPAMVRLAMVEDVDGAADRVWKEVVTGKEFASALHENSKQEYAPEEIPVHHLDPAVRAVVEKLAKGETSHPFVTQGQKVVVYLADRIPETPIPFERVSGSIRPKLESEKIRQQRSAYVKLLRSKSAIAVDERTWNAVSKELGDAK